MGRIRVDPLAEIHRRLDEIESRLDIIERGGIRYGPLPLEIKPDDEMTRRKLKSIVDSIK